MSNNVFNKITSAKNNGGLFQDLTNRIKLILRLMGDKRVNPLVKILPVASLAYLVIPDLMPGPIDDAVIIWLSTYLFVELCPPDVVEEHRRAIEGHPPITESSDDRKIAAEDIIEGEYREEEGHTDTPEA